ncbi:EAL domain-containing protein [Pseudomonas sp. Marseille-QA0892]
MTNDEQRSALEDILSARALSSLFQPIFSLSDHTLYGYEALSRGPTDSMLHTPLALFGAAREAGRLSELERACRTTACERFQRLGLDGKLFLNVSPEALQDPGHRSGRTLSLLRTLGIPAERVVIELTEHAPADDLSVLRNALEYYRAMGFSVALDDLGAGYSSLKLWSELRPDYVKIDRHFIDGIHHDRVKRQFVESILQMAKASRARVIAEGIEQHEELETLRKLGVELVQGYLLGRPAHTPVIVIDASVPPTLPMGVPSTHSETDLSGLMIERPAIAASATVADVFQRFRRNPRWSAQVVADGQGSPIGIIRRQPFFETFHSLTDNPIPVTHIMDPEPALVDVTESAISASLLLTRRLCDAAQEGEFVLVEGRRYLGMGRLVDLLGVLAERSFSAMPTA